MPGGPRSKFTFLREIPIISATKAMTCCNIVGRSITLKVGSQHAALYSSHGRLDKQIKQLSILR
jgi:hypothetical protein